MNSAWQPWDTTSNSTVLRPSPFPASLLVWQGVIAAYFYGLIGPDMVGLSTAVTIVSHPSLGVWTLRGSFIGALVYVLLEDIGSQFTPRYKTLIGVCFVLIVLFLPKGITGLKGNPLQWVKTALSPKAGQSSRS